MERFEGQIGVITGGGTGMGRELARQLAAEGCHVALCDVADDTMEETRARCVAEAPAGTRVTVHRADVADEAQVLAFRDAMAGAHATDHVHLVFNNAGVGGGGSFVAGDRDEWERVFAICWGGVYHGTRAFLPMLVAAPRGHLVNTSSVNGLWASLGPSRPHTAYSTAKFAVRGFTEALLNDLRVNAPHVQAHVVMPGHIGTSIVHNSFRLMGRDLDDLPTDRVAEVRAELARSGIDLSGASDDDIRRGMRMQADLFRDGAPTTAAEAATTILDGVRAGEWRILVGEDATVLDRLVRESPDEAYDPDFVQRLVAAGALGGLAR